MTAELSPLYVMFRNDRLISDFAKEETKVYFVQTLKFRKNQCLTSTKRLRIISMRWVFLMDNTYVVRLCKGKVDKSVWKFTITKYLGIASSCSRYQQSITISKV